jgi:hypothetical protein
MRKLIVLGAVVAAAALALAMAASAGDGTPINGGSANSSTMAVYGDAPYGTTPTDAA